MIERIVTALDGSHRAELAVPYAAYLGAMLGARMELLTVAERPGTDFVNLDESVQRSLSEAEGMISTWIKKVDTVIVSGDPAQAIVEYAADGSTLVAMATHGRTGIMRRIAGSVAEDVLRSTRSPLLLVKAQDNSANIRLPARVANILLPVDMTEVGEKAFELTRLLATKLGAKLTLLHVGDDGAADYLNTSSLFFTGLKTDVEKQHRTGDPGRQIVELVKTLPAPLIVMSSKRANAGAGPIRGSVTDHVVRHSMAPVVVVPAG